MARDSIEQIVCCLMAALALPYLFLSIRLQGADPAQQVATTHFGTVPPDHAWRASSTAQHASALDAPNRTTASAWLRAVPSTAVTAEAALVGVGETLLRPGRDAVEAWLRLRRQTHPGFLGYGRAAGTGTAVGPAHHGVAAMQTAGQLRGRVAGGAALPPGPPSGNAASSSVSLSSEEKALLTRLATPTTRDATAAEERPGGAPRRSPPSKPPPLQPSPVAPPPRHPALPPAPHAGAALPAALPAAPTHELVAESEEPAPLAAEAKRRPRRPLSRCLVFTMDSIESYVARSKRGGASGEITIRESLVKFLRSELNVEADVATSDDHFLKLANGIGSGRYAFVVLDAWTWAAKGWVPKRPLVGHEEKVFLLDFFGAKTPTRQGIRVPPARILTAFPTYPGNTFLGYAIPPARLPPLPGAPGYLPKLRQGVIWGKDPKHYAGREVKKAHLATWHSPRQLELLLLRAASLVSPPALPPSSMPHCPTGGPPPPLCVRSVFVCDCVCVFTLFIF